MPSQLSFANQWVRCGAAEKPKCAHVSNLSEVMLILAKNGEFLAENFLTGRDFISVFAVSFYSCW